MTLSTLALVSRNAAAPLEAISSFGGSAACAPPGDPYAWANDGWVDRSTLGILMVPFARRNVIDNASQEKGFPFRSLHPGSLTSSDGKTWLTSTSATISSGTARKAPNGPHSQVQNAMARKTA